MSSRVQVTGQIVATPDGSAAGSTANVSFSDSGSGCVHDWARDYPAFSVATAGPVGSVFQAIEVPPVVEKLLIQSLSKQDVAVRLNGAPASVQGAAASFGSITNTDACTIVVDGASVAVAFQTGDTTCDLVVARINALANALIASNVGGQLKLTGAKTGGQGAAAKSFSYGSIVLSGAALAKLGLAAGTTYGAGDEFQISGRLFIEPSTIKPISKVEISGNASLNAFVAGRLS